MQYNIASRDQTRSLLIRRKYQDDQIQNNKIKFKIAETLSEFEGAYRLVHDIYVREGYMDPQHGGMRMTSFNFLPSTKTFIGCEKNNVVLTATLYEDSKAGLPIDSFYWTGLDLLRSKNRKIAEVGAFACKALTELNSHSVVMMLIKILIEYAKYDLLVDDLIIVINPKHLGFYKRVLSFTQIGHEMAYEYVKGNPGVAMRLELKCANKALSVLGRLSGQNEKYDKAV